MIEADRLIAATGGPRDREEVQDRAIRPVSLAEYIGQPTVREQMELFIQAARGRSESLDHTLIFGPPGLGKTTLANIIAQEMGVALPSVSKALVSGEAFPPSLRDWLAERGVAGYQCYATADLGLVAYETSAREGLVLGEDILVEIVRPGTGDPVAEGEVGELVITVLNRDYPLIRFGTGDLSAVLPGTCPTGRTNTRIKGWLGRADQTTKVRGMFVHPGQVAAIVKRFPQVQRARLVVSGEMANDHMVLQVETQETAAGLAMQLQETMREVTKLRGEIEMVPPGTLPNDGKVIEDARSYK